MTQARARAWKVTIVAHEVRGKRRSWSIPERVSLPCEVSADAARALALRWAHRDADVPPLRSLLRQSWEFSSAEPYVHASQAKADAMMERERQRGA